MGRLLCIDYGRKRCGIAVTDPLKIVANGLTTVATSQLQQFVLDYIKAETVEAIIVGYPTTLRGDDSESMKYIKPAVNRLRKLIDASIPIIFYDERFTSAIAHRSIIDSGIKKMARRDKAMVDKVSATIILNDYLQSKQYNISL